MFIVTGKHLFWKLAGILLKQKCSWHSHAVLSNVYLLNDECWLPSLFLSVCREQIWTVSPNLFGLLSPGRAHLRLLVLEQPHWEFPAQMPISAGDKVGIKEKQQGEQEQLNASSVCNGRCWALETRVQQKGLFPELRVPQKHIFHKPNSGDLC